MDLEEKIRKIANETGLLYKRFNVKEKSYVVFYNPRIDYEFVVEEEHLNKKYKSIRKLVKFAYERSLGHVYDVGGDKYER